MLANYHYVRDFGVCNEYNCVQRTQMLYNNIRVLVCNDMHLYDYLIIFTHIRERKILGSRDMEEYDSKELVSTKSKC